MSKKNNKKGNGSSGPPRDAGNRGSQKPKAPANKQSFVREGESSIELLGNRVKCADNDWRWYAQDAQLVKDFANFPFGQAVGSQLHVGVNDVDQSSVPGIMTLSIVPSIGVATSSVDPINVAMRKTFNALRKANSGKTNYEAPNLMMYIISVSQAVSYLSWMKRAYGVMNTFSPVNLFKPQALVTAMGFDYASLQQNLNDFRGYINQFAARLNQVVIPAVYSYTRRQEWLYENIYQDSGTKKSQLYMYVPAGFFRYIEGTATEADFYLQYVPVTGDMSYADVITYGNAMLDSILGSQDFNIMAGDILKAYGDAGCYKPMGISESYSTAFTYNAEVLSQMENATAIGEPLTMAVDAANGYAIREDKTIGGGFLVSTPLVRLSNAGALVTTPASAAAYYEAYEANRLLNFHHDSPTPEEVMVASRLTAFTDMGANGRNCLVVGGSVYAPLYTVGSEWVASVAMWDYAWTTQAIPAASQLTYHGPFYYRSSPKYTINVDASKGLAVNATTADLGNNSINTVAQLGIYGALSQLVSAQLTNAHLAMFDWHPAICVTPVITLQATGTMVASKSNTIANLFVKNGSDYLPVTSSKLNLVLQSNVGFTTDLDAIQFDVDVYGVITAQNQANMNWVALLSLFDAG